MTTASDLHSANLESGGVAPPALRRRLRTLALASLVAWLVCGGGLAAMAVPNVSGHLITRDGRTIEFTGLPGSFHLVFRHGADDRETRIPFAQASEIVFGESGATARIRLKDGRNLEAGIAETFWQARTVRGWSQMVDPVSGRPVEGALGVLDPKFLFLYFDDVSNATERRSLFYHEIAKIVLDEGVGQFRRCAACGSTWPGSYLFCPKDGSKTEWVE